MKKKITYIILTLFILNSCSINKSTSSISSSLYEKNSDSLAFELCQIYGFDQGVRKKLISKHITQKQQQMIDTFNFDRIIDFVKMNGFPTSKIIGEANMKVECVEGAFTAVLLHNPHRLVNEKVYFDLFNNEIKKGNLKSEYLANILDKYYWTKSKNKKDRRVLYGSQFGKPCIQTKEATNKARIEIGLSVLNDDGFVDCIGEELHLLKERK